MGDNLAELFRRLTAGVYVVGVGHGGRQDAFTAAWLVQAAFDPLLLALSVNPENASYPLLREGGGFTVNVLRRDQLEMARHFGTLSGRTVDKLAGIGWRPGRTGAPILVDALAYFDCRLAGSMPAGDHVLVLGQVSDGALVDRAATPLTYQETGDLDGSSELYPPEF